MLYENLLSWSAANGLQSPLSIRQNEQGYRYVVLDSEKYVPDNDLTGADPSKINLIDTPLSLCMTSKTSDGLADRLLFEQMLGEDSFYAPYIATLPSLESFQATLPRFWKEDRWNLIKDEGQLHAAVELDQEERLKLSCDDWAQAVVDSRSHFVPPQGDEYSLTPVLDMINHDAHVETSMKRLANQNGKNDHDDDRIQLQISTKDLPTQEQESLSSSFLAPLQNLFGQTAAATPPPVSFEKEVFMSYGNNMPNVQLLLNYGFLPQNNPHNVEVLEIPLIRQDKPLRVAIRQDGQMENLQPLRRALVNRQELQELEKQQEKEESTTTTSTIISKRNELEVLALVGGTLEEAVYDLKDPIRVAQEAQDDLVTLYLQERQKTLRGCLEQLQQDYPDLFGF